MNQKLYVCACHCAQLSYTIQHRTLLIIFPLIHHTFIIAQTLSTGGEGALHSKPDDLNDSRSTTTISTCINITFNATKVTTGVKRNSNN